MFYIIDGYNQAIRYHYGNPTSPSSAVEGVYRVLSHAVFSERSAYVALVLDHPATTYRQLEVPSYKANRPPRPPELTRQLDLLPDIGRMLGVTVLQAPGVEADDFIATLADKAKAVTKVVVISSDKDLHHLVSSRCVVGELPHKFMTPERVREKYGLMPNQILDYLTLVGDVADNIPSIPGHGKVKSLALLNSGRTLDEIVNDPSSSVYPHREKIKINKWLVQPHVVPIPGIHEFLVDFPDFEKVDESMQRLVSTLHKAQQG